MNPVGRALWYIESHFASDPLSLDEIAKAGGVSRYHITRAFGVATGRSIMRYVRGRRLTEAARALANGAPDILAIAIGAGYGSHEAFTRAFRDEFGVTPESVRAHRSLENLPLVEPIKMDEKLLISFKSPRIESGAALLIAGLTERYDCESSAAIPAQWQRFLPYFGQMPGQIGHKAYGVRCNSDDEGNFDYLCGVEVSSFTHLGPEWGRLRIPERRYAVFSHEGHVSTIRRTWNTTWTQWLPESGLEPAGAPDFELYGEDFNSQTGTGSVEIWIPIKD